MDSDSGNFGSNKNRKYDPVTPGISDAIKPGFLGGQGGGEKPAGLDDAAKKNGNAAAALGAAEAAATDGGFYRGDGGDESETEQARMSEQQPNGLFTGSGKPTVAAAVAAAADAKKGNFKGAIKKGGPITALIALIFGVGFLLAGSQLMQSFSLVALLQESFNSMHYSAHSRSRAFMKAQLDSDKANDGDVGKKFGSEFGITEKQKAEFKKHGIEVDDEFELDGEKRQVMKFDDGSGELKIITLDGGGATGNVDGKPFRTVSFDDFYNSSLDFKQAYNSSSMSWRGQFANWFGSNTLNFITNNQLTRNMFKDFNSRVKEGEAKGKTSIDVLKEVLNEQIGGKVNESGVRVETCESENCSSVEAEGDNGESFERSALKNRQAVEEKIKKMANKYGTRVDVVSLTTNLGCLTLNVVGGINSLVAAAQTRPILTVASAILEATDKTKAGAGDESPLNDLMNIINKPTTTSYEKLNSINGSLDKEGAQPVYATTSLEGTAMQAADIRALYGGGAADPNDPSIQRFNANSMLGAFAGGLDGNSAAGFVGCTVTRIGTSLISAGIGTGEIIGCIAGILGAAATFGLSATACTGLVIEAFGSAVASATLSTLIGNIVAVITPWAVDSLTRDLVSDIGGVDLGNAIAIGSLMYMGGVHRYNGGSLVTIDKYKDFAMMRQQVIAEEASEERRNLSPFDTSSKNTFMGALVYRLSGLNYQTSLTKSLSSAASVVSAASVATLPKASALAADIAESLPTLEEYQEYCPYLASIGAIGDADCNPYIATDMSTIRDDPAVIISKLKDNFETDGDAIKESGDGNVIIKKDSDLAKYIIYCGNRDSQFGVMDQNIADSVIKWGESDNPIKSFIDGIPVIGDLAGVVDDVGVLNNLGYVSGQACVAGNNMEGNIIVNTDVSGWETARLYQRFIEDQSYAESIGLIEESAVSAMMKQYYAENPVDNSFEGQLARYSGMDKETVTDLLDIIAYYDALRKYDASERYAFGVPVVESEETEMRFENENVMLGYLARPRITVYIDLRNMNYAV